MYYVVIISIIIIILHNTGIKDLYSHVLHKVILFKDNK